MKINTINSFMYQHKVQQNKNTYATKPIACDTFVKSPSFGAVNKELKYINDYLAGKSFNIEKIKADDVALYLPDLKIVEEFKDKAIEVNKQQAKPRISMTQPQDVFIKSPSFKGAEYNKIEPFLRGRISYTSKNIKKFNEVIESIDFKNCKDSLVSSLTQTVLAFDKKNTPFTIDLMLRIGNPDSLAQMCKLNLNTVFEFLPKIKFSEEMKPNVLSLLKSIHPHKENTGYYPYDLFKYAISDDNVPLLKTMIQDDNWRLFYRFPMNNWQFKKNQLPIIRDGQNSQNPEIKELFNDKNLYNLLSQYQNIYTTVMDDSDCMFDLGMIYLYNTPDKQKRKIIADIMAYKILEYSYGNKADLLSEIPLTSYESVELNIGAFSKQKNTIQQATNLRVKKIIERNGVDTPEKLLACLNDRVMTPKLLDVPYQDYTLIDKIAQIPVTEENKPILSQIMEKLSDTKHLPDNNTFRRAGIKAAEKGNAELLRFFDSKNIHYAHELNKPISNFAEGVQDILKNAKVNNADILEYKHSPKYLENYLQKHPDVDINSTSQYRDSLISEAIRLELIDTLKTLAQRDDVNWNMINSAGETPLMQILTRTKGDSSNLEFKRQALEILRNLPKGRLDVNYINPLGFSYYTGAYTALTKVLYYTNTKYSLLDEVLKFSDIDTNLNPASIMPLCLKYINNFDMFKKIYEHPNTDISLITDEHIERLKNDDSVRIDNRIIQYLKEQADLKVAKLAKKLYEENGILTLDEIEKFANYDNFSAIANTQFNVFGENIAHLLVDIFPDIDNQKELGKIAQIVRKLKENNFDFRAKDELERTPLDKAIEGENEVVADLLRRYK